MNYKIGTTFRFARYFIAITSVTTETDEITHKSLLTKICQSISPCKIAYKTIINVKK